MAGPKHSEAECDGNSVTDKIESLLLQVRWARMNTIINTESLISTALSESLDKKNDDNVSV